MGLAVCAALLVLASILFYPVGASAVRRTPAAPRAPEVRPDGSLRSVEFPACDGTRLEGWLFTPRRDGRAPLVIMAPGLTGTKEGPLERFAWRFARASLRDDPAVDVSRIALWGSSFSGGVAISLAAARDDVAALVAQAPYLATSATQQPGALRMPIYVAATVLDLLRARISAALPLRLPPVYLPAFGVPGEFAFATSRENPSRRDASVQGSAFWRELPTPLRGGWGNALLARFLADFDRFQPLAAIDRVRCPVLLVAAAQDDLVPLAHVEDAFARVAHERKRLAVYDCGHFEIYTDPRFEENAAMQAKFLRQTLAEADRTSTA